MKTISKLLLAGIVLAPLSAFASPVKVDFTVTSQFALDGSPTYDGWGAGVVGSGSFTFDDSVGNFWDAYNPGFAISGLNFTWLGITWTSADAQLYRAEFDASGNLTGWGFGSPATCGPGCSSTPGATDFYVDGSTAPLARYGSAVQHHLGVDGWMFGTVSWTATRDVPEPATLGLFGLGLLGLGFVRRKRAA